MRAINFGKMAYQVVSLEGLMEDPNGLDIVEMALARHRRHGELPHPTEEIAVARIMQG